MSIIAGIYSRQPEVAIPEGIRESVMRLMSRTPADRVQTFGGEHAFFSQVDIGVFGKTAEFEGKDGSISLVAGEPLLGADSRKRFSDLERIDASLRAENTSILREANGAFCGVNFDPDSNRLTLFTDKLGIRPMYYWIGEDFVIFSSALRVLEGLSEVPKRMNVRAVTEIAGLGYPLGDRTPYIDIQVLKAGEILKVDGREISRQFYWKWDGIEMSAANEEDLLDELYARFNDAVSRRLDGDTSTLAYLSGGLDSRCVVAALCAQGAHVHTFNFARPNTQDQILGRRFSQQIKVTHSENPKVAGDRRPNYSSLMVKAWASSTSRKNQPERPSLAWSGEGGSVTLGHVHLNRKIVSLMRGGDINGAIEEFIQRESAQLPQRLLRPEVFEELADIIPRGISEELAGLSASDPARSFYLFLMLNDQRRKLAGHFEDLDLHRLELQLPFFDGAFVEMILSIPVDLCLEHALYVKWLSHFPAEVTAVAWQGYPGHMPCLLPIPDGLSYQWASGYQATEQQALKRTLKRMANGVIGAKNFAAPILNKNNIRLAAIVHGTGFRDYGYMIEMAGIYQEFWMKCNGNFII